MSIIFFIQADRRFGYTSKTEKQDVSIIADGTGYYAYLPQYFIYSGDKNFSFYKKIHAKYPDKNFFSMLQINHNNGKAFNKFYVGTALLQSPFFLVAHIINGSDGDGYSKSYRLAINFSAIFYWIIGVISLFYLFKRLNFSNISIILGITIISFGTNLNFYISYFPSYSHVYSFALIACFLNISHLYVKKNEIKHFYLLIIIVSLIAIIRPINILIILIFPFLFDSFTHFKERIIQLFTIQKKHLLYSFFILFFFMFIQLFVFFEQTGVWSLYTYTNEGFTNILKPEILNVLFSYEKGFFIYAPIMILLILGIFLLRQHYSKFFILGWAITTLVILYFISSWWSWEYGGGLGMRPLIDFLPLLLIPILVLLKYSNMISKIVVTFIIIFGVYIYQIFQLQYNNNIIQYSQMNKEKFWKIFMKTDGRYSWMLDYKYDKLPSKKLKQTESLEYRDNKWVISNSQKSSSNLRIYKEGFSIINQGNGIPKYARLYGNVKIYNQVNNPTIEVKYYKAGVELKKCLQPFGNQISNVGKFENISLEFNPNLNIQFDSINYKLFHYGKKNEYQNLKFYILE